MYGQTAKIFTGEVKPLHSQQESRYFKNDTPVHLTNGKCDHAESDRGLGSVPARVYLYRTRLLVMSTDQPAPDPQYIYT